MKQIIFNEVSIKIDNKEIIKYLNCTYKEGDVVAVLGPNGVGKSTFLKTIMHHYDTKISHGSIHWNDQRIDTMTTTEIAKAGFYFLDQSPVELDGVKMIDLLRLIISHDTEAKTDIFQLYSKLTPLLKRYNLEQDIIKRNVNVKFSGGQKKKSEMLQLALFNPKVILLDEVDSGVDIDTINVIADDINKIKHKCITFIVSHQEHLLELINPNKCIILLDNNRIKYGESDLIWKAVKKGYKAFDDTHN